MEQWISGPRVQVYQTKNPRFKTIRWLKNYHSFHPSKVNLMNIKDSWGLKVTPHSDSIAYMQLNYINKVVYWNKWNLKRGHGFFVKYSWSILLKCSWRILEVCLQYTSGKYTLSILKIYLKYNSSLH